MRRPNTRVQQRSHEGDAEADAEGRERARVRQLGPDFSPHPSARRLNEQHQQRDQHDESEPGELRVEIRVSGRSPARPCAGAIWTRAGKRREPSRSSASASRRDRSGRTRRLRRSAAFWAAAQPPKRSAIVEKLEFAGSGRRSGRRRRAIDGRKIMLRRERLPLQACRGTQDRLCARVRVPRRSTTLSTISDGRLGEATAEARHDYFHLALRDLVCTATNASFSHAISTSPMAAPG